MEILKANYIVYMAERGRKRSVRFTLTASEGESVFIQTPGRFCELHFHALSGIQGPDQGSVWLLGKDLYAMEEKELAVFRREHIGVMPFGGGLIPEISMIDQIILPLKLAGVPEHQISREVEKRTSVFLPMHSLYNLPEKVSERRKAHAAIVRATVNSPSVLILDRALDGFNDIDSDVLWHGLTQLRKENSVLLYFSSEPPSSKITWTQKLYL